MNWLSTVALSFTLKFIELYGEQEGFSHYFGWLRTMIRMISIIIVIFIIVSLIFSNFEYFIFGLLIAIIVPIVMVQKLNEQLKKRKLMILAELPEWVNRLIIRLCAGDSLRFAVENSLLGDPDSYQNPLNDELRQLVSQLKNNQSLHIGLESLNRRLKLIEVSKITSILLLHLQRGGDELIQTLRDFNQSLWLLKKTLVRTRGEEASTRALFPMLLIFLVMLLIIGFPAVQSL